MLVYLTRAQDVARTVYVGDATVRATLNSQLADRWSAAVVDLYNLGGG